MIVSDSLGFAFVHIPKCAGTSVRTVLEEYDEHYDAMTRGLIADPDRPFTFKVPGQSRFMDFHHLTLRQLAKHFPRECELLRRYPSFAIIRDPYSRLLSALSQRMRQFDKIAVEDLSSEELAARLDETMATVERLFAHDPDLPCEYIHFQPQADYIELAGETLVENVYATDQLDLLYRDLSQVFDQNDVPLHDFTKIEANVSKTHRFAFVQKAIAANEGLFRLGKVLTPQPVKTRLRKLIYRKRDNSHAHLVENRKVQDFVQRHYERDIALWEANRAREDMHEPTDVHGSSGAPG